MTLQQLYEQVRKQVQPRLQFATDVVQLNDRVQLKDQKTQIVLKEYLLSNYINW